MGISSKSAFISTLLLYGGCVYAYAYKMGIVAANHNSTGLAGVQVDTESYELFVVGAGNYASVLNSKNKYSYTIVETVYKKMPLYTEKSVLDTHLVYGLGLSHGRANLTASGLETPLDHNYLNVIPAVGVRHKLTQNLSFGFTLAPVTYTHRKKQSSTASANHSWSFFRDVGVSCTLFL